MEFPKSQVLTNPLLSLSTFIHQNCLRLGSELSSRLDDTKRTLSRRLQRPPLSVPPFAFLSQPKQALAATLSSDFVSKTLAGTAVYTVSNSSNEFVLISDPNGAKSIGLLCFRQEDAEAFLAQVRLRRKELRSAAKVVPITLDQVYMLREQAQLVFDVLVDKGLTPHLITYTMMIHGYCKINCLREARDVFNDMKQRGITPDVVTYTVLFDAHSKINLKGSSSLPDALQCKEDVVDASVFWNEMKEMGIRPDVISYTVLIAKLCNTQNLEDGITVFNEISDRGLEPDTVTYTALLCGYLAKGDLDRAIALVDEMSVKGIQGDDYTKSSLERGIEKARILQYRH